MVASYSQEVFLRLALVFWRACITYTRKSFSGWLFSPGMVASQSQEVFLRLALLSWHGCITQPGSLSQAGSSLLIRLHHIARKSFSGWLFSPDKVASYSQEVFLRLTLLSWHGCITKPGSPEAGSSLLAWLHHTARKSFSGWLFSPDKVASYSQEVFLRLALLSWHGCII